MKGVRKARFPGWCWICEKLVSIGQMIVPTRGGYRHATCVAEQIRRWRAGLRPVTAVSRDDDDRQPVS